MIKIKKLNRKTKKLQFIRFKNKLRVGEYKSCDFIKVDLCDLRDGNIDLNKIKEILHKKLERKFKLKLKYCNIQVAFDGLDFANYQATILCEASNIEKYKDKQDFICKGIII